MAGTQSQLETLMSRHQLSLVDQRTADAVVAFEHYRTRIQEYMWEVDQLLRQYHPMSPADNTPEELRQQQVRIISSLQALHRRLEQWAEATEPGRRGLHTIRIIEDEAALKRDVVLFRLRVEETVRPHSDRKASGPTSAHH